jgi:thiosulfate/3-mercaptopyruvate sulfurtransferase
MYSQVRNQSAYTLSSYLVTPAQLSSSLKKNVYSRLSTAPRIIPLCAAWFMPNDPENRTGYKSFLEKRIPKSRFFDLDKVKDEKNPYPHMLPSPEFFAKEMGKLGIRRDDSVVVYDTVELGIFSAPRVAWTLKVFGHHDVHILNNFKLWVEQGFPTEKGEPENVDEEYYPVPELEENKVVLFDELRERTLEKGKDGAEEFIVLDARGKGRFDGSEQEPRPGMSLKLTETAIVTLLNNCSRPLIRTHSRQHIHSIRRRLEFTHEGVSTP